MTYQPKRMLVTGGAGFIGSIFIQSYLSQSTSLQRLVNLDCLSYAGNLNNLGTAARDPRYRFVEDTICNRTCLDQLLQEEQIDTIVHFAAESHVDRSIATADAFIETNIVGTYQLLDAAKQYWLAKQHWTDQACRFHHISTDEVYGSLSATDTAFTETTPYAPRSPYSASKASSDHLVRAYAHTHGLPITISNCSNNYGPNQHREKFIPTIIHACLEQNPIPIYGDGSQIRDWLFVQDHAQAIQLILHLGRVGETYNIGGNNEWSNLAIAKLICQLMDTHAPQATPHEQRIEFVTDRAGHDWRYAIDSSKLFEHLGWQAQTDFKQGLEQTIQSMC